MATRKMYSWWWDSHNTPKNSKWLQENLQDMDGKVKAMIKLIEEDADSFARRAEMYYKKRPELMKLVEDFYRAYRALAERYDHATVELRYAHKTISEAFPDQVNFSNDELSPGSSVGDNDFSASDLLNPASESSSSESNVNATGSKISKKQSESKAVQAGVTESEFETLKKAVTDMQAETEAVFLRYQQALDKVSTLEGKLEIALKGAKSFNEQRCQGEEEIKVLKEALKKLTAERDVGLQRYKQCLNTVSQLEIKIFMNQHDAKEHCEQAAKAEIESQNLKQEVSILETEKETILVQYKQCLSQISDLENRMLLAEENTKRLAEQNECAESELNKLRQYIDKLKEEKEAAAEHYQQCIEIIAKLKVELSRAQENAKQLKAEILVGNEKLEGAEEQCDQMMRSNRSLQSEVEDLRQKIFTTDQESLTKQATLVKLETCIKDERSRALQLEASLSDLKSTHSQCLEDRESLTLELKGAFQNLHELEIIKHGLQDEINQVKREKIWLNNINLSSNLTIKDLQIEITSLQDMKKSLEDDVSRRENQSNILQLEVSSLNNEIKELNSEYRVLLKQVELAGLRPESLGSSVKKILDENLELKELCDLKQCEKVDMAKKLSSMEMLLKINSSSENSLANVIAELERSKQKFATLQESCQFLKGEKLSLIAEKATLLSQLQIVTEMMQNFLKKNNTLEDSLTVANAELGSLKEKSKNLEEICQLLQNENCSLLSDKSSLVLQLENVEKRLRKLETNFAMLESEYAGLDNEKKSSMHQVEELGVSLRAEKQICPKGSLSSTMRLDNLENHLTVLQEGRFRKREYEEELEKSMKAQVEIFILQKFIHDLEEKNFSLMTECEKQAEERKFSNKMIAELEKENLEQQVETEILLDEIEKLRSEIYIVFRAFQTDQGGDYAKIEREDRIVPVILLHVKLMKDEASKVIDDKQRLLVENLVLVTLIGQLKSESDEVQSEKVYTDFELEMLKAQLFVVQTEKDVLLEMNKQLKMEVFKARKLEEVPKQERANLLEKLVKLHEDFLVSETQRLRVSEENTSLMNECLELKHDRCTLENENSNLLHETIASSFQTLLLEDFGLQKVNELKSLENKLESLYTVKSDLEREVKRSREEVHLRQTENLHLINSLTKMKEELCGENKLRNDLHTKLAVGSECLVKQEMEILIAKGKLEKANNSNLELSRVVEALKKECEDSNILGEFSCIQLQELADENDVLNKKIEYLTEAHQNLELELDGINAENENYKIRELKLSSEIENHDNECKLREYEVDTMYSDLQISTVHEVVHKNKVKELIVLCMNLQEENSVKDAEIKELKGNISSLERNLWGLETELSRYPSLITSLKGDLTSLEGKAQGHAKDHKKDVAKHFEVNDGNCASSGVEVFVPDQGASVPNVILELQEMRQRIKKIEKVMMQDIENPLKGEQLKINTRRGASRKEIEPLCSSSGRSSTREGVFIQNEVEKETRDCHKLWKLRPIPSEIRNRVLMKDIPLDEISSSSFKEVNHRGIGRDDVRMLDLLKDEKCQFSPVAEETEKKTQTSTKNKNICYHSQGGQRENRSPMSSSPTDELVPDLLELRKIKKRHQNKGKIMETLTSDSQKLTTIQTIVQNLRRRLYASKKPRNLKGVGVEVAKEQLQEVEDALLELMEINSELMLNMERCLSLTNTNVSAKLVKAGNNQIQKVSEQAMKASEKIRRLQVETQKVQLILSEQIERKTEAGLKVSRRKTSITLMNFIKGSRGSDTKKLKRRRFCGCIRPQTKDTDTNA